MEPLYSRWKQVSLRLAHARTIAIFLDFDGTLAGLRAKPSEVFLNAGARRDLAKLTRSAKCRVWVISGRRQADLEQRIHIPGIQYLGLHGWEGRSASGLDKSTQLVLADVKKQVDAAFADQDGIWIEDKGATIAVHHRAPAHDASVLQDLKEITEVHTKLLRLVRAKNVWEIVPRQIEDKGEAVRQQMATIRNGTVPLYVGDDLIDEPAFRALAYGITVHVGRRRNTKAKYWLPSVGDVHDLLGRLATQFA